MGTFQSVATETKPKDYIGCKGCIEYMDCDYSEYHEVAKKCPCITCVVKMICKDICAEYERHHDLQSLLDRPLEDGG
jgi:hypothetical protein